MELNFIAANTRLYKFAICNRQLNWLENVSVDVHVHVRERLFFFIRYKPLPRFARSFDNVFPPSFELHFETQREHTYEFFATFKHHVMRNAMLHSRKHTFTGNISMRISEHIFVQKQCMQEA